MNQYQRRLMAAFPHPAHEYVFVRHFEEDSFCECGHSIYHNFVIEHPPTGHQLVLGSECIENYSGLESVRLQVAGYLEQKKEDARKAKLAKEEGEVALLAAKCHALFLKLRQVRLHEEAQPWGQKRYLSDAAYRLSWRMPFEEKEWKTAKRWKKAYEGILPVLEAVAASPFK